MPTRRLQWASGRQRAGVLGLSVALLFTLLAVVRLGGQGLYYDELHQAVAAFDYLGHHSPSFNHELGGIPVLNMSYSGAIKSNVYGLYLRFLHPQFSVVSWRLLGILFVACGLAGFYLVAGDALPTGAGLVFGGLVVSDVSLLLASRHDWGPVALNLSFRLLLVGVWISAASRGLSRRQAFFACALVGLATFEKLTSVVLFAPLALLLVTTPRREGRVFWSAVAGLFVGFLPLGAVNIASYVRVGHFVSLQDVQQSQPFNLDALLAFIGDYLGLGAGQSLRAWILDAPQDVWWVRAEVAGLSTVLMGAVAYAIAGHRRHPEWSRGVGALVAAYVLVAVGLWSLPHPGTWVHHWVVGSPFQYAAIALTVAGVWPRGIDPLWRTAPRIMLGAAIGLLLLTRLANLASTEAVLLQGRASESYSVSLSRLGRFAARHASEAAFVSVDWGTATAVYCLTNGADDVSYESSGTDDPAARMEDIASHTRKDVVYLVVRGIPRFADAANAAVRHMRASPDWREETAEDELRTLKPLVVMRFVRRERRTAGMSAADRLPRTTPGRLAPSRSSHAVPAS